MKLSEMVDDKEETNTMYGVYQSGGSIGNKNNGKPLKTFNAKADASDYAKRLNKGLSPGEKSYYKLKYTVRRVKEEKE